MKKLLLAAILAIAFFCFNARSAENKLSRQFGKSDLTLLQVATSFFTAAASPFASLTVFSPMLSSKPTCA